MTAKLYRSDRDNRKSEFRTNRRVHRQLGSPCVRCMENGVVVPHTSLDHRDPNGGNGWANLDPLCDVHKLMKDDLEQARKVPLRKNGTPSRASVRIQLRIMLPQQLEVGV